MTMFSKQYNTIFWYLSLTLHTQSCLQSLSEGLHHTLLFSLYLFFITEEGIQSNESFLCLKKETYISPQFDPVLLFTLPLRRCWRSLPQIWPGPERLWAGLKRLCVWKRNHPSHKEDLEVIISFFCCCWMYWVIGKELPEKRNTFVFKQNTDMYKIQSCYHWA